MTNAERYAILNRARRVLAEIAEENFAYVHEDDSLAGRFKGVAYERARHTGDALADVLIALAHFRSDPDAARALEAYDAGTDQDPDLDDERRLSEGRRTLTGDREAELDNSSPLDRA